MRGHFHSLFKITIWNTLTVFFFLGCLVAPIPLVQWWSRSLLKQAQEAWAQSPKRARRLKPRPIDPASYGNIGRLLIALPNGKKQALQTRKLLVRVTIQGRTARTEVEQIFYNPTNRQTEGEYTFQLPDGAAIVRLAMDVNGRLMEGELVERTKARAIYHSIVRQMKDPALLEWQSGNRFRTQIFPIPARGTKRVILAYDHVLHGDARHLIYRYQLPRAGSGPPFGLFQLTLKHAGNNGKLSVLPYDATIQKKPHAAYVHFSATNFRSRGHFVVQLPRPAHKGTLYIGKVGKQRYGLLTLPIHLTSKRKAFKRRVLVLDTSAGLPPKAFQKALATTRVLLQTLPDDGQFGLLFGDVHVRYFARTLHNKSSLPRALDAVAKQRPQGATDLKKMLLAAIKLAGNRADIIYIGDGIASIGELDPDLLTAALQRKVGRLSLRLSAITIGPNPNIGLLRRLAHTTSGRIQQLQVGQTPETAVHKLQTALKTPQLTDIQIKAQGLNKIQRMQSGSVASGDSLLLAGELTKPAIRIQLTGRIDHKTPFTLQGVYEPSTSLSQRIAPAFWARWTIRSLEQQGIQRRRIVKLSKTFGVMSRYTSFLVLENDRAYKKYQIARRRHNQRRSQPTQSSGMTITHNKGAAGKKNRAKMIRQWMHPSRSSGSHLAADAPRVEGNRAERYRIVRAKRRAARRYHQIRRARRLPSAPPAAAPSIQPSFKAIPSKRRYHPHRRYRPHPVIPFQQRLADALKRRKRFPMNWSSHANLYHVLMQAGKYKRALQELRVWRRYARENADLIIKEASLLKRLGKAEEGRRVLNELVEFAPHAYARRTRYAQQLELLGNITAACKQYAQAVRLNPSKRDTFRTMMKLYRIRQQNSEYKEIIRRCIVDGVSRLPVVRDISMVLFWDDNQADIDLHIHEPGGEEVSYRHRESRQGGTLYYDITDGLGPEIYVLGTGKKGTYRVTAVLYRGNPQVITGQLIVMRHAGSPREIRKTYRVVLHRKNGRKPVFITTINIP